MCLDDVLLWWMLCAQTLELARVLPGNEEKGECECRVIRCPRDSLRRYSGWYTMSLARFLVVTLWLRQGTLEWRGTARVNNRSEQLIRPQDVSHL